VDPLSVLWLVARLSFGEVTYLEEHDSADACQAALVRLEALNRSVDRFRCVVEFSTSPEPMPGMPPPMLGSPP
jgi:hypothetical protein